jgi:hypothetical protein
MKSKKLRRAVFTFFVVFLGLFSVPVCYAAAAQTGDNQAQEIKKSPTLGEQWGVQLKPLRLTGDDLFLDFRFRVIDPEKAAPLLQKGTQPYLLDQKSGKTFQVPTTKVGPMRATSAKPKIDKDYTMLFNNPNRFVKKGDKVTVVIGDFKAENLVVE